MIRALPSAFAVVLSLTLLAGCDNPACVFGGSCAQSGAGGGVGTEAAAVPADGEQLLAAAPTLVRFAPSGTAVDPKCPIVLSFSESMASTNLSFAFELNAGGLGLVPLSASVLAGDGHLVVLFPLTDLQTGVEYTILYRASVVVADRTGQAVVLPPDRVIGSFTVATTTPTLPTVVATWPDDQATNQSPTSEIDVVFSRPMDAASVVDGWGVTVGGVAPTNDPDPAAATISGLVSDTRLFRWRSTDGSSQPVSLGTDVDVQLELSPAGHLVKDSGGNSLANKLVRFKTLPFLAPTGAALTSVPTDAIGVDQVTGPQDLAVRVDLDGAQAGDRIGVYLFGKEPQPATPVPVENLKTIALLREVPAAAPFTSFTFTAGELDLVRTQSPLAMRFTDGTVTFAFYLKRGGQVSPIKLLDVDPNTRGVQSPIQDTVPPTVLGLSTSGTSVSSLRSDQRDVVIVGRASEILRAVSVGTPLGDNEQTPNQPAHVAGSSSSGLFVAAPVRLGVLTPSQSPLAYTVVAYDRALNSSGTITGQFTQIGQAADGAAGTTVTVEVFDSGTLAPIANALVIVHESVGGTVGFVAANTTTSNGRVTLPASLTGETIVTVDARTLGYDPFTFDGVPNDHVSIPLTPNLQAGGTVSGSLTTSDTNYALYTKSVADTRFAPIGETLLTVSTCSVNTQTQTLSCSFTPTSVSARQIGGTSAVVVLDPPNPFLYSALTFLKAFRLAYPVSPVEPGETSQVVLAMGTSLDAGTLDPEERPVDVAPQVLSTALYPSLSGTPRVRVEATAPGLPRAVTVGRGIAFNDSLPANTYAVRAAYPGSCDGIQDVPTDVLGSLVTAGTIDGDLVLRVEAVDTDGNRGGARPRLSAVTGTLAPPGPPTPDATPFVANPGPAADFRFADTLLDSLGEPGLHRAVFADTLGSTWTVWRLDRPDSAGPLGVMHLPRVAAGSTFPLSTGNWSIRVSSWSWPTLSTTSFLWSDVEREAAHFAHAALVTTAAP